MLLVLVALYIRLYWYRSPPAYYDLAHAVLPDPKLTPGDVFADATKDDVCAPGWAR